MVKRHLYLQWDSTDLCNLRCNQCYHEQQGNSEHKQMKHLMNLEEVFSMINDLDETAKRWEMIPDFAISGGEPLMRKDLYEILDYTNKKNLQTKLLSNGTLITKSVAKELKNRNVRGIQVSIDGGKEMHNQIRKMSFAYDRAMEGIFNASQEKIPVNVAMTLMKSNKDQFEEVIIGAISAGALRVGFKTYVPDSNLGYLDPNFVNAKEFYEAALNAKALKIKYQDKIEVITSDVLFQIMAENHPLIEIAKKENKFLSGCSIGYRAISVLSDGTVYPCRRLPISIGNISEGLVKIFVETPIMKEFRDMEKIKERCSCDKVVHCRGCRAIAFAVTGDYLAKDPMCYKEFIEDDKH